ncbi:MAG TPA: low affinity iron permease family protein [Puia sp.]|jgi:low affinity Fe/Cu permease|nr:low affinity iron permease family protein [Puia sp.]
MTNIKIQLSKKLESITSAIIRASGGNLALILAFATICLWFAAGFIFHFSEEWKSDIGVISSVITILMVFLIQKSQNKDSLAIQLKLNELVAATESASNRLVDVEGMTQDELKIIQKYYSKLSQFAQSQSSLTQSHSIDEIHREHQIKAELDDELNKLRSE